MKRIALLFTLFLLISCNQKNKISVDTIITNANIYTVNKNFDRVSAIAINEGKIVAVATNDEIISKYDNLLTKKIDSIPFCCILIVKYHF